MRCSRPGEQPLPDVVVRPRYKAGRRGGEPPSARSRYGVFRAVEKSCAHTFRVKNGRETHRTGRLGPFRPVSNLPRHERNRADGDPRREARPRGGPCQRVEAEQRQASATLATTREAVAEFHRRGGGRPAERDRLEQALAKAKAEVDAPWAERIEGARRQVRDKQAEVVAYVNGHLTELVATLEDEGDAVVSRFHAHIEGMVTAYVERGRLAGEIASLIVLIGPAQPGDVSRTRAEELVAQAQNLLRDGGERPSDFYVILVFRETRHSHGRSRLRRSQSRSRWSRDGRDRPSHD
jgi:hypothetical protein